METTFPFAAFQVEQHFSLTIQIAPPFRVISVFEMVPCVRMYLLKPFETFLRSGQLIPFQQGDKCLDMYPPEFLIPFKLLGWKSFSVHKIEYSTILFIPTIFQCFQCGLNCFLYQPWTVESYTKIHDKPHRFDTVSRIDRSALESV